MLHELPLFNDQLARANSIRCMFVRSGTSRVLLLDGAAIRAGKAGHDQVRRIMLGADGHGGFGGMTSQDNKVALVCSGEEAGTFRFRCLQVVAESGAVLPMECSNSAAASAMMAQLSGRRDGQAVWRATNLSTGQKVELRPDSPRGIARSWSIRFLADANYRKKLLGWGRARRVQLPDREVEVAPVLLGNLFLFTDIAPDLLDEESLATIAKVGMGAAREAGWKFPENYHPKVIPYRLLGDRSAREVETAGFYHGERHRSMPGSAAMALASFLELRGDYPKERRPQWTVRHTSGAFDVRLGVEASGGDKEIFWAEFTTPVRLLGWGVALDGRPRRS